MRFLCATHLVKYAVWQSLEKAAEKFAGHQYGRNIRNPIDIYNYMRGKTCNFPHNKHIKAICTQVDIIWPRA